MAIATAESRMLREALGWASMGFPVFPVFEMTPRGCACSDAKCTAPGKHPRVAKWQLLATTEDQTIREWFGRWKNANIGICCGRELSGGGFLFAIDVDPRHDGDVTLALLEQKHGALPETPRNLTGGGGHHILFRAPRLVKSRSNALGDGVDVKCDRGYILAPPSNHESGRAYQRDAGADVGEVPIADVPPWVLVIADKPEPKSRTEIKDADAFIEGGRHNAIVSLAGTLRRRGLRAVEMLPTLLAVNAARCRPPLDDTEIKRIAGSSSWAPSDPLPGSDGGQKGIPWLPAAEIFAPLPPYPWLIHGLHIAPGRITLLSGYADVGKTVVAQSMALSVAAGKPIFGVYSVARPGAVLHLNGEISGYLARERYQRLARAMGLDLRLLIEQDRLRLANYPRITLDEKDAEARLTLACEGCVLVVVDSLRSFSGSIDENSKEIGVALLMLARVSEATGATIIVLHHNRKPQKDQIGGAKMAISGSSSIPGGSESIFVMSADKGGPIVVEHERTPLGKKLATFGLRIEDVGEGNDPRSGLRVVHMEGEQLSREDEASKAARVQRDVARAVDAILTTLRKGGGGFKGSRKDLRAVSGVGEVPFSHALASLLTSGDVLKRGTYHEPEWHVREA